MRNSWHSLLVLVVLLAGCAGQVDDSQPVTDLDADSAVLDQVAEAELVGNTVYKNDDHGFKLTFPGSWGFLEDEVKKANLNGVDGAADLNYEEYIIRSQNSGERYLVVTVFERSSADADLLINDFPALKVYEDEAKMIFINSSADCAGKPGCEDDIYFEIEKEFADIVKTFELISS